MSVQPQKPAGVDEEDAFSLPALITGGASIPRNVFLEMCRDYLSHLQEELLGLDKPSDFTGRRFVNSYSKIVDAVVGMVFFRALEENHLPAEKAEIAVLALGGYGREELAPYSDVDILFLCKRKTRQVKRVATIFIQLMWDVGFELGHSVESLVESESVLARHPDTKTALLESRWICGSQRIAREICKQISRIRRKDREEFLIRKVKDARTRHRKYDNSYQLVEPNVKLSPGGLRDYQTLGWLGMVAKRNAGFSALRNKGLLLPGEEKALNQAYDFLLKVRVVLHTATRSKQDQLTVRMQKTIAEQLGYGSRGDHLGVELFMKDYYTNTRTIFRITEDILEDLQFGSASDILLGRKKVVRDGNKLNVRIDRRKLRSDPLYVFNHQKQVGLKLDRAVKRRLAAVLESDLTGRREIARMRKRFAELFRNGKNNSLILHAMHETGFLGQVIPEYNFLSCLKRYDLYHHYTVDEHSFKVVRNLELLIRTSGARLTPFGRLYFEIPDKQVLFLAALLHDVGKIEGRGHARKGAVIARKILTRIFLKPEQIDAVCYLIEHHLLMSHFSQRRDPTDIGTLEAFCSKVKNRTNLKYLCLLTYADLKATSPVVWTEWKRNLVWALYLKAHQYMAKKEKRPEAFYKARKRDILKTFPPGAQREKALEHLDLLPGRYLLTMRPSQVKAHLRLVDRLEEEKAVVVAKKRRHSTEITFCTPDKPFRLSQLCGVLTMNDLNILHAHAFTRKDGKVIDVFHVEDLIEGASLGEERVESVREDLLSVLRGPGDIRYRVNAHVEKWKRRRDASIPVPLKVEIENDLSGDFTIIDIFAPDAPGLLFKITYALSSEGLVIYRARISTEANRAIDAFYVHGRDGGKVTRASKLRRIRTRLEKEIA
ncbi:MAG: [protein-PII] uridylyltransferase [Candidatus Latescibacteria bacterium]|nr:[protein-PII] uridylyltransferase [Candidatus Latescibacterota bacterium]NIM22599.1 [protein-PII] uridylyltransferase [Candidatus Latescibacterota bacterium]NIM64888.1 [protein-PII] uridylyltransferase [Candidatus Latescibacterota bacterium]NIO01403.1 [protein-PII] uridylyltransferase [Candidatus Latescibacterota bacterium]NIO27913.1 [protein-PII] uridylyltransferase [Candidatus Latescibacterota bacterium]